MMERQSMPLSVAVLVAAGAYQFTPWKAACLRHCHTPGGSGGACHRHPVAEGAHHGMNCLGSCGVLLCETKEENKLKSDAVDTSSVVSKK